MKKYNFLLLLCTLTIFHIVAQNNISGVITGEKNQPLTGVSIYIHDHQKGSQSDDSGHYSIHIAQSGSYLIEFNKQGYKSAIQRINIVGNVIYNLSLLPSVTELDEVVVTGSAGAVELRRQSLPLAVIQKKQMELSTSSNLIDALQALPGINAISTGPNLSKPMIRGLSGTRILTLYNGIRQEGQQWGEEHGIEIDEFAIDRVEIIKGPASLVYGSDALGGVINLLPPHQPAIGKKEAELTTLYHSNSGLSAISLYAAGANNKNTWSVRMSHKKAHAYYNPIDGYVFGTGFSEYDLNASTGFNFHHLNTQLYCSLYDNTQGVPTGDRDSISRKFTKPLNESGTETQIVSNSELQSFSIPVLHQRIQHYRIQLLNKYRFGGNLYFANFGYQQSVRREYAHPEYKNTPGLYLTLHTYTWDIKWNRYYEGIEFSAGYNGMIQVNKVDGTDFLIPAYLQFDEGLFFTAKKDIGKWTYNAGIRFDYRKFSADALYSTTNLTTGLDQKSPSDAPGSVKVFTATNKDFKGISGSAGVTGQINSNMTIKFNLGRGYRAPNVAELSASGVHPGTGIHQTGSSQLVPEFNHQGDVGILFHTEHLNASVDGFANLINQYIFNERIAGTQSADSIDADGNIYYAFKQANAILYGGELNLDFHPHPLDWMHIENATSMIWSSLIESKNDSAKYLPLTPPIHIRSAIRLELPVHSKIIHSPYFRIEYDYFASQQRVWLLNGTETNTESYGLLNAGVGFDLKSNKNAPKVCFRMAATNLLNTKYQSHLSRLKYMEPYPSASGYSGIYGMGRNLTFKLIFTL